MVNFFSYFEGLGVTQSSHDRFLYIFKQSFDHDGIWYYWFLSLTKWRQSYMNHLKSTDHSVWYIPKLFFTLSLTLALLVDQIYSSKIKALHYISATDRIDRRGPLNRNCCEYNFNHILHNSLSSVFVDRSLYRKVSRLTSWGLCIVWGVCPTKTIRMQR